MIVNRDAEQFAAGDELLGDDPVVDRRCRISGWVVVDQDNRCCAGRDGACEHLTRMNERGIQNPARDYDRGSARKAMLTIQRQNPERFADFAFSVWPHQVEHVLGESNRQRRALLIVLGRERPLADQS
jgi:hypothetical protein